MNQGRWAKLSRLLDAALTRTAATRAPPMKRLRAQDADIEQQLDWFRQAPAGAQANGVADVSDHRLPPSLDGDDSLGGPRPDALLGRWRLVRQIGEGGMGQVWLAVRCDGLYVAQAAIKLLRVDRPTSNLQARFARERAVLARLNHPAIARLLDAGVQDEMPYLVLEYVDGLSLTDHARIRCPHVADRIRLVVQIAAAVDHAHALLVVHRDLKPSNVLVTTEGHVKLLDFGIAGLLGDEGASAQLTSQGGVGMTPGYAAPEQILGLPVSTATDVFSLGIVLFELLTGTLPFGTRGIPRIAMEHAVLHEEPRRLLQPHGALPSLPPAVDLAVARGDLEAIVAKALRKDPGQRYQHVGNFIDDLECWQTLRAISVRGDDRVYRLRLWLRRNRMIAVSTAAVVVSLCVGLAVTAWHLQRSSTLEARSERVIDYLSELLASGNPDRRTQRVPTVLDVLDRSRSSLDQRFQGDPEAHARLLDVLADAYASMERPDVALKMVLQLKAIVAELHGADDPRMIEVRLKLAQLYTDLRLYDDSRDQFVHLLPQARQKYGELSPLYGSVLSDAFLANVQTGRLDEAARLLTMSKPIALALPEGDPGRARYDNNRALLSAVRGRFAESRELLQRGGHSTDPASWLKASAMQRSAHAMSVRLGDYRGVESGLRALVDRFDTGIGNRSNLESVFALYEIAHMAGDMGQYANSLRACEEILQRLQEGGMDDPAVTLPVRSFVLRAQARMAVLPQPQFRHAADELLVQVDAQRAKVGYSRLEVWQAITHAALAMDDAELARRVLALVRSDPTMDVAKDALLSHEMAQLEGQLARLQGDLWLSREQLRAYVQGFDSYPDRSIPEVWSGMLDLAYTQVLMHDPAAADTLRRASGLRPAQMPANSPLDAVAIYLATRLKQGDASPTARGARAAIAGVQRRQTADKQAGLGTLGGAFL